MKTVWNVFSVLAIANLLALGGLAGWLFNSGRLNEDRVEAIRTMLAETVEEERTRQEEEQSATDAEVDEEGPEVLPVGAESRLADGLEEAEVARQIAARQAREAQDLRRTLIRERAELDRKLEELEAERTAFNQMRDGIKAREGEAQFNKSLAVYAKLKPASTQELFSELLDQGEAEQVVAYLNAMDERIASKVIEEFNKAGEPDVAADLLERMRVFGLVAQSQ